MSPKYSLNAADLEKIFKGLLIAVGGAAVTYGVAILPNLDLGKYAFLIFPLASTLFNAAAKYLNNPQA